MAAHLPLNALKAFEAAARHLSFSKAAEELHVTPAAVSQQVRILEDQLGIRLFHRLNRSLALTDEARAGLDKLREGFDALSLGVQQMRSRHHRRALSVWAAPSFTTKWLLPRLPSFAGHHADIDMRFATSSELIGESGSPDSLAHSLRQHDVDVAIRFGRGNYPGCRVDKLFSAEVVPLCSPALLQGEHALRAPRDLEHHVLLHDDTPYQDRPDWNTWLHTFASEIDTDPVGASRRRSAATATATAGGHDDHDPDADTVVIDADRGIRFNHVSLALQAAIEGQGVALSLLPLAEADIDAGRLVIPFDLRLPLNHAYYVVSLQSAAERAEVKAFRDWLLQQAQPV